MAEPRKLRVGVLHGGVSAEREISLCTGKAVGGALREAGFTVEMIDVRDEPISELGPERMDVAFVALHGTFGEDGGIQAVLDALGVPYTGSGVEASRLAMDKVAAKGRFLAAGVPTAPFVELRATWPEERQLAAASSLGLPVVIKPASEGSSLGVTIVQAGEHLATAVERAFEFDSRALAEQYIAGRELTVGILDDQPLPIIELLYEAGFFTYEVKYTQGAATHVVEPDLPPGVAERVRAAALAAHRCLGCGGCTRVDLRLGEDLCPYILEVNTIPGMTDTSLVPDAARAVGMSFPELCERMVELAVAAGRRAEARKPVEA